jgi:IS5 family transposase
LPDHSSLTRTRQRWGAERFRRIFERSVQACIAAGIAKGEVVHVDASLIRADVSWESLAVRHVDAVGQTNGVADDDPQRELRNSKKTGKFKKVCVTDPDASMATSGRNRRLEPSYKQHGAVDDAYGVILDVEVSTGELNEGQAILERLDAVVACTGTAIDTVTADAGYAYAKVFAGLENREITAIIPTKAEPIRSKVPLRRFRYDARHDLVKCPRGKILRPNKTKITHGRFFASKARDCRGCDLAALCLSPSRATKSVVIVHDYPALLRARRRREAWSEEDRRLYRRHRWRAEGFHGEAKTWHGLARAVRRGLDNMRIQSFLTATAINLKRLAASLLALLLFQLDRCRAIGAT